MSVEEFSAEKEYEKQPKLKVEDVEAIREWMMTQPHLPHKFITDLDIILAHHRCKHDSELTKQVIDLNFTLRSMFTFYSNRVVDKSLQVACHTWLMTPLSVQTFQGYRAVYCHLLDPNTEKFVYRDVIRAFVMILDLWQYEEGTLPDLALIVNMDNVTLGHISGIDLTVAQQFFFFLQDVLWWDVNICMYFLIQFGPEAMFIHIKEFHFINAPNFVDKMLSMIKPFLKEDLINSLKIHPVGSSSLDEYMTRCALPKEAGGKNKDCIVLRDEIYGKLKNNAHFFDNEANKRVDESKRLSGAKTISSFFPGIDGSFKKLSID